MSGRLAQERDALVDGEQRPAALVRRQRHGDDDLVEDAGGALDDVEVAVRHRVERPGAQRALHLRVRLPRRTAGASPRYRRTCTSRSIANPSGSGTFAARRVLPRDWGSERQPAGTSQPGQAPCDLRLVDSIRRVDEQQNERAHLGDAVERRIRTRPRRTTVTRSRRFACARRSASRRVERRGPSPRARRADAPRDSASRPSAPVPANRSSTGPAAEVRAEPRDEGREERLAHAVARRPRARRPSARRGDARATAPRRSSSAAHPLPVAPEPAARPTRRAAACCGVDAGAGRRRR